MRARPVEIQGDIAIVPLSKGMASVISAEDAPLIAPHNWYAKCESGYWYAVRKARDINNKEVMVYMHRALVGPQDGCMVDHVNGDTLDNRRANLREATNSQNQANSRKRAGCSSALKGVTFIKSSMKWQAQIKNGGKSTYLGLFETEQDAHAAYLAAAKAAYGEFASSGVAA